ncbi:MAG TPA: hypothetical protein VFV50_06165 [Bdellovibrionales bacterium]|nr:hypothetical protein [Bdellovibrionales bacterium]
MAERSKLGRNPLFKKRASPVSGILEPHAEPAAPDLEESRTVEARHLFHRLQQMEIEMDLGQVVRRLYGRIRRRPV